MMQRSRLIAGLALIVAPVVFWTGEAVAAHAWTDPAYSYTLNYISDLGVTSPAVFNNNVVNSPDSWALNGAWIINGLLVLWAATLAPGFRSAGRLGRWMYGLTVAYAVGLVTIAFFHEAPAWMFPFHLAGAVAAIGGGNVAVILTTIQSRRLRWSPVLTAILAVTAAAGSVFFVLQALPHEAVGAIERGAAYPVLAAQLIGGIALLLGRPAPTV